LLKLAALDAEDLTVISASMQDAVLLVGDMSYRKAARQFALVANRFAWDAEDKRERRRTGLHFDRVLSVKTQNIRIAEKDAVLSLLSITFKETDTPSGDVLLTFSGGGTVRLTVECLECQMQDLGPAWTAGSVPAHKLDDEQAP
jgi:hypothetical protein